MENFFLTLANQISFSIFVIYRFFLHMYVSHLQGIINLIINVASEPFTSTDKSRQIMKSLTDKRYRVYFTFAFPFLLFCFYVVLVVNKGRNAHDATQVVSVSFILQYRILFKYVYLMLSIDSIQIYIKILYTSSKLNGIEYTFLL